MDKVRKGPVVIHNTVETEPNCGYDRHCPWQGLTSGVSSVFLGLQSSRSLDAERVGCSWYQESRDNVPHGSFPVKLVASLQSPGIETLLISSEVPSLEASCEENSPAARPDVPFLMFIAVSHFPRGLLIPSAPRPVSPTPL